MNIRLADNTDKDSWNAWVQSCRDTVPYHLFAWKTAVETAYGHKAYYLMAEYEGRVGGILPLIYLKPPLFHGQLVSLPFCDAGDALAGDDKIKEALILKAVSIARELNVRYLELRSCSSQPLSQHPGLQINSLSHKVRMLLDLPESSGILWDSFDSKLRSQIRKAEKNDLKFIWGEAGHADDFYKVFSRNMRDLGSPVHSKKWFQAVLQNYDRNARIGLVYHNEQPVGSGIMLSVNNRVSVPWASTLKEYNSLSPNMLLYWNFLKYAADNQFAQFDFGRSTPEEGTYKFKAQWGALPAPMSWNYIMTDGKKDVFKDAHSAKRELIMHLWKRLPLSVANSAGPQIRKYISL